MLLNWGVGEDFWESLGLQVDSTSLSWRRSTQNIHWKDWCWSWSSNTLAIWCKELTHWRDPNAGKDWRQEEKGVTEGEIVGWHHQLNGYELEQILRDSKGQGGLACFSTWGCKESDMTESLYNNNVFHFSSVAQSCPTLCDTMDSPCQAFVSITNSQSYLNSCPSSRWCHPTISSSIIPFSSHIQSFPA